MRKSLIAFALTLALMLVSVGIKAQTVVYSETFENFGTTAAAGVGTTNWDRSDNDPANMSNSYQWRGNTSGHNGKCAYSYMTGTSALKARLKSPTIAVPSASSVVLSFWIKGHTTATYCGTLNIYYSTDGGTTYLDKPVALNIATTSKWVKKEFLLPAGCTGNVTLVFEAVGSGISSSRYIYLDDLELITAPKCQSPAGLYIGGLSSSTAIFNWSTDTTYARFNAAVPDLYVVTLKDANDDVVYHDTAVTASPLLFTNLNGNTTYTVSVYSDCESQSSLGYTDSVSIQFHTLPPAIDPPYSQDFESITEFPDGIYYQNASVNTNPNFAYRGSNSAKLDITSSDLAYIAFPLLNLPADDMEMSFMIRRAAGSADTVKFLAGYMTDPSDITTFIPSFSGSIANDDDWHSFCFNTSATLGTDTAIMPCINIQAGTIASVFIDNVDVDTVSSCTRPENITFSNTTSGQTTLSWVMSNAPSYTVTAMALSDSTVTTHTDCTNPYTFTGLRQNAYYEFTVQGVCSATDSSAVSAPFVMKTECGAVADTAVFFEGAEGTTGTDLPFCWATDTLTPQNPGTTGTIKPIPFITQSTATYVHTGSRSFQLQLQKSGAISYLCSQGLDFEESGKYTFRFWMYRPTGTSTTYQGEGLKVFVTPTPGDTTNGVVVIPFINRQTGFDPVVSATGWYEYEGVINYGDTGYIMIVGYSKYGSNTYFDDMRVIRTPSCPRVSAIKSSNVNSSSAKITWSPGSDETQWTAEYHVKLGTVEIYGDTLLTSSPELLISGLTPQSAYTVYGNVRAICGVGDTAEAVAFSTNFTTRCAPLATMPYTNDFESETTGSSTTRTAPACWSQYNDGTSSYGYPYVSSSTVNFHSGSKGLTFYAATTASYGEHQASILPEVDTAANAMNTLRLKFWAKRFATISTAYVDAPMIIGIMSDPADLSTFDIIDTVLVSNNTAPEEFIVSFAKYNGTGTYPAIRLDRQSKSCYCYVDDVTIEKLPDCLDITASVVDLGANEITIALDDTTAAADWSYAYGLAGTEAIYLTPLDTVGDTLVISGLAPQTQYVLYVRRNCGAEHSPWSNGITFTTTSVPASMPYICGFDNAAENALWQFKKGNSVSEFTVGSASAAVHTGTNALYVSNDNGTSYAYAHATTRTVAYRTIHFDAKGYQIEFFWKCPGGETGSTGTSIFDFGSIMLLPTKDGVPAAGGNTTITTSIPYGGLPQDAIYLTPNNKPYVNLAGDEWHFFSEYINFTEMPGNYNLVLVWNNDGSGGTAGPLAIDDITITELNCLPPSSVLNTGLAADSATLTITQSGVLGWDVIVDTVPFDKLSIPANPLFRRFSTTGVETFTGLTPNTEYYYSVSTICSATDTAIWMTPASFRTLCAAYEVPATENFEDAGSVNCWTKLSSQTGGDSFERTTTYKHNGLNSLKVVKATVATPEYAVDSLTHYMVNGWVYSTADSLSFGVGVVVNPADIGTYENIIDVLVPAKNTWTEFTAYFTALSTPEFADFKDAKHIAIACGNNTLYFDDIYVDLAPTCPKPTEVRINNIQANSFDISFTDNTQGTASQWIVYANDSAHVISTNPATITGLTAHTPYHVYIAALCAGNDTSHLTDCGYITTACDALSTPWSCGFERSEGYSGYTAFNDSTSLTVNADRNCWNVLNNRAIGTTSGSYSYVSTSSTYTHSGTQGTYNYILNSGKSLYYVLPDFTDPANMLKIKFWYKNSGTTTSYPELQFGYFTDPYYDTSFVSVASFTRTTTWTEQEIMTNNALYNIPANVRVGFALVKGTTAGSIYLDDISVLRIRSCSDPDQPTVSDITASSAKVTITDACTTHTAWEYVIGTKGFDPNTATPVSVDTTVFTINGLTDDTDYDIYVRAYCGVGDESNFIKTSFTTLCLPYVVTDTTPLFDGFEDLIYNVPLAGCYTVEGNYLSGTTLYYMKGATKNSATIYSHSGDMCLHSYIYCTYSPKGQTAYRQVHLTAGKTYKASVWIRSVSYAGKGAILFGSVANADSMTVVASAEPAVCTATSSSFINCWEQISGYITVPATGDYVIALHGEKASASTSTSAYVYFDDFMVEELAGCLPTGVIVDSVTQTTLFAHHEDTVATHNYEYMVMRGNDTIVAPALAASNTFSVSGLPHTSSLTIYLRQTCGEGNYSEWSTANFETQCGIIDNLPYTMGFEDDETYVAISTYRHPKCWNHYNNSTSTTVSYTAYPYVNTTASNAHSGSRSLYSYSSATSAAYPDTAIFALPEIDTRYNLNDLRIRFWARQSSASYSQNLWIGVMTDPDDPSTFTKVASVDVNGTTYVQHKVGLHQYTGNGRYVALGYFKSEINTSASNTTALYLDDVVLETIPPCEAPDFAPVLSAYTKTTATLSVDMSNKSLAEIRWTTVADPATTVGTVTTTDGMAVATNLVGNTAYSFSYRYACSETLYSDWSPVALCLTKASDCFAAENVRLVGESGVHDATITWNGSPDATGYVYELYIGSVRVDSVVTANDTVVLSNLASNVEYTFLVRTLCDSISFSGTPVTFQTKLESFTAPFVCDFSDANMNNNWTTRMLSTSGTNHFTIGSNARTGNNALYVSTDNVNYSYNNSSAVADAELFVNIPAGRYYISYDWNCTGRASGATIYDYGRVFLAPADTTITGTSYTAFNKAITSKNVIPLDYNAPLTNSNGWASYGEIFEIPADGAYKLVVLWANSSTVNGDPLAIDNFSIQEVTCMPVKSVNVFSIDSTEAVVTVKRYNTADVYYALSQYNDVDSITNWTLATSDTITFSGLTYGNSYYFFARHACSASDLSVVRKVGFTMQVNPVSLPFISDFESDDPHLSDWNITSGTATNFFTIGSAVSNQGSRSLYVTDDGTSHKYTGSTAANASWSYAYVPLQFNAGTYEINYQWKCYGESTYDYGHIFLAPASMIPADNVQLTGMAAATLPTGCIALDADFGKLNLSSEWVDALAEVSVENACSYNLIIAWHNDGSTVNQPPLAIDNVSITRVTCNRPVADSISLDSVSTDMIRIKVHGNEVPMLYHVAVSTDFSDTAAYGILAVGDSLISAYNLSPSTFYYLHLANICESGDTSSFTTLYQRTDCGVRTSFPYEEGFENYVALAAEKTQLSRNCWLVTPATTSVYHYASTTASYVHSGKKGLYIYNGTTVGTTQVLAMPQMDTIAGKQLNMWYKNYSTTESANYARLEIGYLSDPDNVNSFVNLYTAPYQGAYAELTYDFPNTVPANVRPAFRTNGTYAVEIDDIHINKLIQGVQYSDYVCYGEGYSGHGFICPTGTLLPGDTVLTKISRSTTAGAPDSIISLTLHVLNEIVVSHNDTTCAYQPYSKGQWNIVNPSTRTYSRTFTSVYGCDSAVTLNLYVVPTRSTVRDTICQGDVYPFHGQSCTQTGTYVAVDTNIYGCLDTTTLYLLVVDSTSITNRSICQGDTVMFEGNVYSQTGTYVVTATGIHNCPVRKTLNLTVHPVDSVCNVSFCEGGYVVVGDTTITTPGTYEYSRLTPSGCVMTYHITATEIPLVPTHVYDDACEGKPYTGYGIHSLVITADTVVVFNIRTVDAKCDSVSYVHLTLNPNKNAYDTATIAADSIYYWNGYPYTEAGDYTQNYQTYAGCDSIAHLHLIVETTGVETVADVNMTVVPNPVNAGATAFVYGEFGEIEKVEILNNFGQLVDRFVPESYPIEVSGISAAGLYYVRVTTKSGSVHIQKLIVK